MKLLRGFLFCRTSYIKELESDLPKLQSVLESVLTEVKVSEFNIWQDLRKGVH